MPKNTPLPDGAWARWLNTAKLGGHSQAFRNFEGPRAALACLRASGLSRVELWTGHLQHDAPESWGRWKDLLDGEGFTCEAVGVFRFTGADGEQAVFEMMKAVGATVVTADYSLPHLPKVVTTVDAWAQASGLKVALHNNGAPHWLGNRAMLSHLIRNSSPSVGLCLDTFWALDSRENGLDWIREIGDRLFAVHLRDGVCLPDRTLLEEEFGKGATDLRDVLEELCLRSFAGPVILESKEAPERQLPIAMSKLRLGPASLRASDEGFSLG